MKYKVHLTLEIVLPIQNLSIDFEKEILLDFLPVKDGPTLFFNEDETDLSLNSKTYKSLIFDIFQNKYYLNHNLILEIDSFDFENINDYVLRLMKLLSKHKFTKKKDDFEEFIKKLNYKRN